MQSDSNLRETLRSIDHKSYPAYKSLRGSYRFADYVLSIDHVQGDPFAAPSHVRVTVDAKAAAFPEYAMKNTRTRTALADELLRKVAEKNYWKNLNCCARLPHRSTTLHLRRKDRAKAA